MTEDRPNGETRRHGGLTAMFGHTPGTAATRMLLIIVAVGTLAIILAGVLTPRPTVIPTAVTTGAGPTVGFEIGNAAPNFTLPTLNGKRVSLSDYRGKPVMLNFWYADCPGCQVEIPDLQRFYARQQATGKEFTLLGINLVDDAQTAQEYAREKGMTYSILLDEQQRVGTLYNLRGTPTSFFIDRRGIIRSIVVGPIDDSTLLQKVEEISR